MSTSLVQTGIGLMILIAIAAVVFTLTVSVGAQVTSGLPAPEPNTLFYNLTKIFTSAVNTGAQLLGPLLLIGFAVIVIAGVAYIWAMFGGARGFGR